MPELPEVETVCRNLREGLPSRSSRAKGGRRPGGRPQAGRRAACPSLLGRRITGSRLLWPPTLVTPAPARFRARVRGQRVREVTRRGKFILVRLTTDTLLFHLRMGGALQLEPRAAPLSPHCRLVLELGTRWQLVFCNPRKFGRVWLTADPGSVLGELGPEPLADAFSVEHLSALLAERHRRIKPLLLDQRFLAGLGNIYADEALHRARIHPLSLASDLPLPRRRALWGSIRKVLREAIRYNGTSFDEGYSGGAYFTRLRVYQRTGRPCRRCGTPIERILVGQRSTHFCPACQARPGARARS